VVVVSSSGGVADVRDPFLPIAHRAHPSEHSAVHLPTPWNRGGEKLLLPTSTTDRTVTLEARGADTGLQPAPPARRCHATGKQSDLLPQDTHPPAPPPARRCPPSAPTHKENHPKRCSSPDIENQANSKIAGNRFSNLVSSIHGNGPHKTHDRQVRLASLSCCPPPSLGMRTRWVGRGCMVPSLHGCPSGGV
jgi:hypothetical protein